MVRKEIQQMYDAILALEENNIENNPHFIAFSDGSGHIEGRERGLLNSEDLEKIITFCKKHNLTFQVFGAIIDKTILDGKIRIDYYLAEEEESSNHKEQSKEGKIE